MPPRKLPPHTRLILAADELLSLFGSRTLDGYRISAEWGKQKPEGWYEPIFTVHYDDDLQAEVRQEERARLFMAVASEPVYLGADAGATMRQSEVDRMKSFRSRVLAILDAEARR